MNNCSLIFGSRPTWGLQQTVGVTGRSHRVQFPGLQVGVICISKAPDPLQRSSLGKDCF
jgi:hypothetical protein